MWLTRVIRDIEKKRKELMNDRERILEEMKEVLEKLGDELSSKDEEDILHLYDPEKGTIDPEIFDAYGYPDPLWQVLNEFYWWERIDRDTEDKEQEKRVVKDFFVCIPRHPIFPVYVMKRERYVNDDDEIWTADIVDNLDHLCEVLEWDEDFEEKFEFEIPVKGNEVPRTTEVELPEILF